jgi:Flp pilus assembly protein TadG
MAVEAAIIFPLLMLLTMGAIRYGWLFLKAQQLTNAARVGVRIAIRPDATAQEVTDAIDALFTPDRANISGHTITFFMAEEVDGVLQSPVEITDVVGLDVGVAITVKVTVPCANVDIMNIQMFKRLEPDDWDLGAEATMGKEGF